LNLKKVRGKIPCYKGKTIGECGSAHNEEKLIVRVIDTLPDFVDAIIVVNDASMIIPLWF
jgi:hypothetical protein